MLRIIRYFAKIAKIALCNLSKCFQNLSRIFSQTICQKYFLKKTLAMPPLNEKYKVYLMNEKKYPR